MSKRYIKVADARRLRNAKGPAACGCGTVEPDPQWYDYKGKPRAKPLCRECHEREVLRKTHEDGGINPANRIADE